MSRVERPTLQEELDEFHRARRELRDAFVRAFPLLGPALVRISHWIWGRPR